MFYKGVRSTLYEAVVYDVAVWTTCDSDVIVSNILKIHHFP